MKHYTQIVGVLMLCFCLPAFAQQSTKGSGTSSVVRSVETIGKELMLLFGSDDDNTTNTTANTNADSKPKRKKVKMALAYTQGKTVVAGDAKTCESGNGICSFTLYPANQAPKDAKVIPVMAMFMPRQKKLALEFDSALDASLQNESGKIVLVVRRVAGDGTSTDGVIMVKNRKIAIQNGDYEVTNNRVILTVEIPTPNN